MEYTASGNIMFYPTVKLKLDTTVEFNSPSGEKIALNSTDDNDLAVRITLEEESDAAAKERAEIELKRICDLLSYFYDISILGSRITGMVSMVVTPEGKHVRVGEGVIAVDAILSLVKGLGPGSTPQLVHHLVKEYPPDFEDVISMWREAISMEVPALKYLLLYRLMEKLFRDDTKALTAWIKAKESSVECCSNEYRGKHTIYTYLRDNIHAKPGQKVFPLQQMRVYLPRLQSLVRQRIEEIFGLV
jgi:hypothetical protein